MVDRKNTELDWDDVRVFLALARHGSLSGTARALGINHATVARRVSSLEQAIGARLVNRRPEGYLLTDAGNRLLEPAGEMQAAAEALKKAQVGVHHRGLVRINVSPSLAQCFLIKNLASLHRSCAGLDLEIATDMQSVSLDRREADIALRLVEPKDGDVIATHLASINFGFYGTVEWFERVTEGLDISFVGFDEHHAHLRDATWLSTHYPKFRPSFRTSSHASLALAAREGIGIALLPHFVAKAHDDKLVPCPLLPLPPTQDLWMVSRHQDRGNAVVQMVRRFLVDLFEREARTFEYFS